MGIRACDGLDMPFESVKHSQHPSVTPLHPRARKRSLSTAEGVDRCDGVSHVIFIDAEQGEVLRATIPAHIV